ncbi:MAG TPA: Lpp/OprI family alanine-zipper lipoprotein, partial [Gammaproteobacteria bacterium]|nr:Lpp/OprI family alanine-zipper lipoprotein [Gammaproteobacteria bacterium]
VITRGFKSMKKNFLYAGVAVIALGVMGGCATTELDAVRATAEQALNEARAAKTTADAARAAADEAKSVAANAQSTASRAAQAASEAQACCAANTDRIERMFQRGMSK